MIDLRFDWSLNICAHRDANCKGRRGHNRGVSIGLDAVSQFKCWVEERRSCAVRKVFYAVQNATDVITNLLCGVNAICLDLVSTIPSGILGVRIRVERYLADGDCISENVAAHDRNVVRVRRRGETDKSELSFFGNNEVAAGCRRDAAEYFTHRVDLCRRIHRVGRDLASGIQLDAHLSADIIHRSRHRHRICSRVVDVILLGFQHRVVCRNGHPSISIRGARIDVERSEREPVCGHIAVILQPDIALDLRCRWDRTVWFEDHIQHRRSSLSDGHLIHHGFGDPSRFDLAVCIGFSVYDRLEVNLIVARKDVIPFCRNCLHYITYCSMRLKVVPVQYVSPPITICVVLSTDEP